MTLKTLLRRLLLITAFSAAPTLLSAQDDYDWAPDFPVGSEIIEISAQDQNGTVRSFDDLKGEKGLLFMLSRSFDW
ncbi:MAG: hypothetical protein RL120_07370 [Gammaproteobacteria bacterium]